MESNRSMKQYVFHCILANKPVCVKWTHKNGFYADLLEDIGVWERNATKPGEICWKACRPMILEYGDQRHELSAGDTFWLSID